jgi:steroid delta-isomerase-like uncharacterized protein
MLEQIKTIANLATEMWNTGDLSRFDEVYATNYVNHDPSRPHVVDYESLKALIAEVRKGMPDFKSVTEDLIVEKDKFVIRWVATGKHTGTLTDIPIPPTGKKITQTGMTITRVEEGKIVEAWWNYDMLGALQQMGVIPSMQAT